MISFIHRGGPGMASYRYRCEMPARELGANVNDLDCDTLVFCKPSVREVGEALAAKARGARIVVDVCDDHLDTWHYQEFLRLADLVTCPTPRMQVLIQLCGFFASVIPDCYLYEECEPHCNGDSLLWFGHGSNLKSLDPHLGLERLRVVSNAHGCIPWSDGVVRDELRRAAVVLMPATRDYKSPNRTLEAIRMGCFVAADPHPALENLPVWKYGVREGVQWALNNRTEANWITRKAQDYIRERFAPRTQASVWRTLLERSCTSAADTSAGPVGSTPISTAPIAMAT